MYEFIVQNNLSCFKNVYNKKENQFFVMNMNLFHLMKRKNVYFFSGKATHEI